MMGGAFFVGGSVLFFPSMEHIIMHGGWLYITGHRSLRSTYCARCILSAASRCATSHRASPPAPAGCTLTLLAALLGALTAYEMRKTALPNGFYVGCLPWPLSRRSDEEATMMSCSMYVLGNVLFIVGSVFFFPRILEAGGVVIREPTWPSAT
jgi:hypothetical protein